MCQSCFHLKVYSLISTGSYAYFIGLNPCQCTHIFSRIYTSLHPDFSIEISTVGSQL